MRAGIAADRRAGVIRFEEEDEDDEEEGMGEETSGCAWRISVRLAR